MNYEKRSGKHERAVQELRRSNAAGIHGDSKYNRRTKHPNNWLAETTEEDFPEEEECHE